MDRKRAKKMPNEEWVNPHDPEAEIARLKDGRTAPAYKAEQAVDMETGAIVTVTTQGGATGDTESIGETLPQAAEAVAAQIAETTPDGKYPVPVIDHFLDHVSALVQPKSHRPFICVAPRITLHPQLHPPPITIQACQLGRPWPPLTAHNLGQTRHRRSLKDNGVWAKSHLAFT
jgi:hypothetical protein